MGQTKSFCWCKWAQGSLVGNLGLKVITQQFILVGLELSFKFDRNHGGRRSNEVLFMENQETPVIRTEKQPI